MTKMFAGTKTFASLQRLTNYNKQEVDAEKVPQACVNE
jgi:hypothetical protein